MGLKKFIGKRIAQQKLRYSEGRRQKQEIQRIEHEEYQKAYTVEATRQARLRGRKRAMVAAKGGGGLLSGMGKLAKHIDFDYVNEQLGIPKQKKGKKKKSGFELLF